MIILRIITGYEQAEGCEPEIYQWVAIDGDRCVVMRHVKHNAPCFERDSKGVVCEDQYGITVQENPHNLSLPQEAIEAITQAVQGTYDTSNLLCVKTREN